MMRLKRQPPPDYQARAADLRAAEAEVGATAPERLRWLIRFAQEHPARWHSGKRSALGDALYVIVYGRELSGPPLAPALVSQLHAQVSRFLRTLLTEPKTRGVVLPADPTLEQVVVRASAPGERPAIYARGVSGGKPATRLLYTLADLLVDHGERVIACRGCGTMFWAIHRARYCSTTCNQRARNARKATKRKGGPG